MLVGSSSMLVISSGTNVRDARHRGQGVRRAPRRDIMRLPRSGVHAMLMRRGSALVLVAMLAACSDPSTSPTTPTSATIGGGVSLAKPVDPGYTVYQDGS